MKIEKIFIRNFRPIGEQGLELVTSTSCSTFIGENNVGKSSIFEALKKILEPQTTWDKEDWHAGDQSKSIVIRLDCILEDDQIKQIIEILELSLTVNDFRENFGNQLIYKYELKLIKTLDESYLQTSLHFQIGELHFGKDNGGWNTGWFGEIDRTVSYTQVDWREVVREIKSQKNKNCILIIKEFLDKAREKQTTTPPRIVYNRNISEDIRKLLKQSIVVIEEFREKPHKVPSDFLISPDGRELANVLFNLTTARPKEKRKFEQIREKFLQLFPNLRLDVIRENNEIKILIQKAGIESTTFYLGAGILESLLLITHLIAHSDKVLCVDHPELHLHPHAQRRLEIFIEEALESQILSITHSPYFVNLNKGSSILRFIQKDAQTEVIELPQNYFTDNDFFKLEQCLDIDTKELFFARKVVLVEGPTELGALPIFASDIYNFDENGISVIFAGGKKNFDIFVKLCEGFKFPYLVIADNDAEDELLKLKEKYPDCKSHILPGEFDDLLPEGLKKEAKNVLGDRSKPRIGRYVAKKLVERGEIPEEISLVIEKVKNL